MSEDRAPYQITPEIAAEPKIVYNWQKKLIQLANACKAKAKNRSITLVVIFETDGCVRFSPSTGEAGGKVFP